MRIDWTTFVLEIVNFLVLVWILKHFLYKPVRDVLNQRRAAIGRTLEEARETEERATALKSQFESRLAEWEKEKTQARARLDAELNEERTRQMHALTQALAEERERDAAREARLREQMRQETEARALAQARGFATTVLARLAGPELEARLMDVFIEDFSVLTTEQTAGLRAACRTGARADVATAFPLSPAQRRRIADAIAAQAGHDVPLDVSEDATLVAGLRIAIGPWRLALCLGDELAFFAAAGGHAE